MIDHKKKIIFLHPNKCGGKSVEQALWGIEPTPGSADHRTPQEYIRDYGQEVWGSYFKFGFARNPWDRMVSIYHGRKQILGKKINRPFHDWIVDAHDVRPQWLWFSGADWVGRFENYEEDFISLPFHDLDQLPHVNKSKHRRYTEYYNEEAIQIVMQRFEWDIRQFGYRYGD